jgi:hypothetical protein
MPHEDPLEFDDPAYDAATAAYYENLAPPGWFYPFVGEVASEAVLLELYMAKVALALTGRDADAREVITSSQRLWGALNDAKGRDGRFDAVLSDFQTARDARGMRSCTRWCGGSTPTVLTVTTGSTTIPSRTESRGSASTSRPSG